MKRCSAEEAAALLRPRDTMILGFGPAQPGVLLEEMGKRDDGEDLTAVKLAMSPSTSLMRWRAVFASSALPSVRTSATITPDRSTPRWSFFQARLPRPPCLTAAHSPSPTMDSPVLPTMR